MKLMFFVTIFLLGGALHAQYPIKKPIVRKLSEKEYKKYILDKKSKDQKKKRPFVYRYV